jgi:1-acyl-sn-glycerol-3-phosphate acyltransferase
MGAFPVKRGEADRNAVRHALEVLDAGAVVGLFPEGHRQRDRELGDIRTGVAMFSLREGPKTIPVVMRGTDRVVRNRIPRFPRVRIVFGPPLDMPGSDLPRSERVTLVTERLIAAFEDLLNATAKDQ